MRERVREKEKNKDKKREARNIPKIFKSMLKNVME